MGRKKAIAAGRRAGGKPMTSIESVGILDKQASKQASIVIRSRPVISRIGQGQHLAKQPVWIGTGRLGRAQSRADMGHPCCIGSCPISTLICSSRRILSSNIKFSPPLDGFADISNRRALHLPSYKFSNSADDMLQVLPLTASDCLSLAFVSPSVSRGDGLS
ncbi:hypothetical protein TEQG_01345 [Trichophyton equinum CBS 127.97]|uniref:Uncharacterized protein n=1 Tax=Trichophyton equinum (strain ATCC MYA-4606 / CBS 127.97) TaxID=559882 RepID=F2PK89_TRIEC|nr:hypothetical protein TEQG_01345 [Trichophyton equinum CBS 127.97]